MRCPAARFITHTLSHICFLILLAAATFRIEEQSLPITSTKDLTDDLYKIYAYDEKVESLLKDKLRPANTLITNVQICLMFWIMGKHKNCVC